MALLRAYVGDLDTAFYRRVADILVLAYVSRVDFSGSNTLSYDMLCPMGSGYRAQSR